MKIKQFDYLADYADEYREHGLSVVQCHGTFDLLHIGHIKHLQKSIKYGSSLFVTITADAHVNKGNGRPVFNEQLRAEALAALECVDIVSICPHPTAIQAIHEIKPNAYIKGADYIGKDDKNLAAEKEAVESHGGVLVFVDGGIQFSSTKILKGEMLR